MALTRAQRTEKFKRMQARQLAAQRRIKPRMRPVGEKSRTNW